MRLIWWAERTVKCRGGWRFLALIFALWITGCATAAPGGWKREGAGDDELARDRYACTQESRVGDVVGSEEDRVFWRGQNKLAQTEANRLFAMCMAARGWRATPR